LICSKNFLEILFIRFFSLEQALAPIQEYQISEVLKGFGKTILSPKVHHKVETTTKNDNVLIAKL
jgi:hypothetical protein